jgi:hypothetical protein
MKIERDVVYLAQKVKNPFVALQYLDRHLCQTKECYTLMKCRFFFHCVFGLVHKSPMLSLSSVLSYVRHFIILSSLFMDEVHP